MSDYCVEHIRSVCYASTLQVKDSPLSGRQEPAHCSAAFSSAGQGGLEGKYGLYNSAQSKRSYERTRGPAALP